MLFSASEALTNEQLDDADWAQPSNRVYFSVEALEQHCIAYAARHDDLSWTGIVDHITAALGYKEHEERILDLPVVSHTLHLSNALQACADHAQTSDPNRARRALRLLVKRVNRGGQVPYNTFTSEAVFEHGRDAACLDGGFSDVFCARSKDGSVVALKRIRVTRSNKQDLIRQLCREALIWRQLKHPYVLPFIGVDCLTFPDYPCLVSPWMSRGTLLDFVKEDSMNGSDCLRLIYESACGVDYLHKSGVVHGDIRAANVFMSNDLHPQLADFGLSGMGDTVTAAATTTARRDGSVRWMAPELQDPEQFEVEFKRTPATDMYAFGGLALEVITKRPPFSDVTNPISVSTKILRGIKPAEWPLAHGKPVPHAVWSVIDQCWSINATNRPTTYTLMKVLEDQLPAFANESHERRAQGRGIPKNVRLAKHEHEPEHEVRVSSEPHYPLLFTGSVNSKPPASGPDPLAGMQNTNPTINATTLLAAQQAQTQQNAAIQHFVNTYPQEHVPRFKQMIQFRKSAFHSGRNVSAMQTYNITPEQRNDYDILLERIWRISRDLELKLPIFLIALNDVQKQEEVFRKFIPLIASIDHQRQILVSGMSKFLLNTDMLRIMDHQLQTWHNGVYSHLAQFAAAKNAEQQRLQGGAAHNTGPSTMIAQPPIPPQLGPAAAIPTGAAAPSAASPQPPVFAGPAPLVPVVMSSPRPPRMGLEPSSATHAQKPKAQTLSLKPKPKVVKGKPRPSSLARAAAPVAESPALAPSTVKSGHSLTPFVKRRRDEDQAAFGNDAAPSPRRVRVEGWDTPGSSEARAEGVRTDGDTTAFFEQTQSLLARFADGDGSDQAALPELSAIVPNSSTNPSPESATPGTPKLAATKVAGEPKTSAHGANPSASLGLDVHNDPLRLGAWGEIDGGEAAYWQNVDGWQWQEQMPTTVWAILQS